MAHKPTRFQLMAFAVIGGSEMTIVSNLNLKDGKVTVSDYSTELEEPARRFAQASLSWLQEIAKEVKQPITEVRVRYELCYGERAPSGFLRWKQENFFSFDPAVAA